MKASLHNCKAKFQQGFSIVELMIALVLGLGVVAAVGTLSVNASRSYRVTNLTTEEIENGRYGLSILKNALEHAGFFGVFNPLSAKMTLPATAPNTCSGALQSYADSFLLAVSQTCTLTLSNQQPGTASLILIRASSEIASTIISGNTYIQANPTEYILGQGTSFISNGGTPSAFALINQLNLSKPADVRKLHVQVFYLRTYSQTPGDGIPTLMVMEPTAADPSPYALIDGIENMQIQYGLDGVLTSDCGSTTPSAGDGAPDAYYDSSKITCWKDWSNVVTVRLNLLARSLLVDPQYTDTRTYDLGQTQPVAAKNDHFHRHVFSQVVRLINVSQRLEQ